MKINSPIARASALVFASAGAVAALVATPADAAVLIRNDFSTIDDAAGSVGTTNADGSPVVPVQAGDRFTPPWVNPSGHEGKPGGTDAGLIGLGTTYDHDNNDATAEIEIPGFYEVNGWDGGNLPGSLTITTTFPDAGAFDTAGHAVLRFWAAARESVTGGSVRIRNVTDNVDVLPETAVTFAATATNWQYNEFSFVQDASYAGDTFEVTFFSGSTSGAEGLELTDITFESADVPEPASLALLALGGGLCLRRRNR